MSFKRLVPSIVDTHHTAWSTAWASTRSGDSRRSKNSRHNWDSDYDNSDYDNSDYDNSGRGRYQQGLELITKGEYLHAEIEFRAALSLHSARDPIHIDTPISKQLLADSLYLQQKYHEAELHYRHLVGGREKTGYQFCSGVPDCTYRLAKSLFHQNKFDEAEVYFRQVVKEKEIMLGEDSPEILDSKSWLAASLFYQDKFGEAGEYYRQVVEGMISTLGSDHLDILYRKNSSATDSLHYQEKCRNLETHCRKADEGWQKMLDQDRVKDVDNKPSLVDLSGYKRKCMELATFGRKADETWETWLTRGDIDALDSHLRTVQSVLEHRHSIEAIEIFQQVVQRAKERRGCA